MGTAIVLLATLFTATVEDASAGSDHVPGVFIIRVWECQGKLPLIVEKAEYGYRDWLAHFMEYRLHGGTPPFDPAWCAKIGALAPEMYVEGDSKINCTKVYFPKRSNFVLFCE